MCLNGGYQRAESDQAHQTQWKPPTLSPSERLAVLLNLSFNVNIAPGDLEYFIRAHWDEIAPLAHKIHGGR